MARTSRLWRRLGMTAPIFNIWSEEDSGLQMTDRDITAITITRGSAGGGFGEQEHTLEVTSAEYRNRSTGNPVHCDLTASGANRIASLIGGNTANIVRRYFGRIGKQTVDDIGGRLNFDKWGTTIYASKWQSQLRRFEREGDQINGSHVVDLFEHFMDPTIYHITHLPTPEFPSHESRYGVMRNNYSNEERRITYSEFSNKYLEAPGYYVKNMRAGHDRVMTIERRWTEALQRLETHIPLLRSQVLSPATWEQPNEDVPSNHMVVYQTQDGEWRRRTIGPDTNDERIPLTEHDVSYIGWQLMEQPTTMLTVRYARERLDSGYRVPTVEIDLLRLIDSDSVADRRQARQLLEMEMGDPVFFSSDWHHQLRGVHFAEGITETIAHDQWTLSLSLTPSISVVGEWPIHVPAVTWDSAPVWWDNALNTWDEPIEYEGQ